MKISTDHPFYRAEKEVAKLCGPLFLHTPFKHFDYEQFHFDGNYLTLGLNIDFLNAILLQQLLPNVEELSSNTSHYVFLCDSLAPELTAGLLPEKFIKNNQLSSELGIFNRLCIIFNTPTYVEIFIFGLTERHKNPIGIFMQHISFLERFCVYFRETTDHLIKQVTEGRIIVDYVKEPQLFSPLDNKSIDDVADFFSKINLKKFPIKGRHGNFSLSKREFECLLWTAKDRTAKQVGRILGLSERTVETYLINLKNKMGCKSKFELINSASDIPIIKTFL